MNFTSNDRVCNPYQPEDATSGPRNAEHSDDVLDSYSPTNLAVVTILGDVLLNTAHSSSW